MRLLVARHRVRALKLMLEQHVIFFRQIRQHVLSFVPLAALDQRLSAEDITDSFAQALRTVNDQGLFIFSP